ncbi:MAG: DotU/TssL family secretion system protein [Solidesulfovibrio sp. DCME]|uniref:DotU/TssL family secretion system protein n=1 Tax=Solidesulfovibrio sp. DCME TaxID=3447380 RepID=UPI003D138B23
MTHVNDYFCDIFAYVLALLGPSGAGTGYDQAREDLLGLFQAAQAKAAAAGFDPADSDAATFAVAAWADETVLRSAWEGAKRWQTAQLQQLFFNTHNAGVGFYDRLAALAPGQAPARETYALCLGLGFQGKFFDPSQSGQLDAVRQEAIRDALGEAPAAGGDLDRPLFPEAYQPAAAHGKRFNPWAFDWWFFLIPLLAVVIAAEAYLLLRNDLNVQLLGFFGSLR